MHAGADPLFVAFKELGTNQGWLADLGMGHKTWTFGYAHDKALATEVGLLLACVPADRSCVRACMRAGVRARHTRQTPLDMPIAALKSLDTT